jgi:23S rRNA (cytidine2498-2'-O)-methyltransferase
VTLDTQFILTAHPEFLETAARELKRFDPRVQSGEVLAPGIALCSAPDVPRLQRRAADAHPLFARHLAPVQAIVPLNNTEQDIGALAVAIARLPAFAMLERGQRFSVQARFAQGNEEANAHKRAYTTGMLNQQLARAFAEETGAVENIKKPQVVVSLLCTFEKAYAGLSLAGDNLSDWPGGMRHFAHTSDEVSRAEFKLQEALEVFGISLPSRGAALDLGAAPGGWTHLLLEAGLRVVAVDPARLDPRLERHPRLEHYRGYAEDYLADALRRHRKFDIIANDMRVDAREAARALVQAAPCLQPDGMIVSTLKLPHATDQVDPLKNLNEALALLSRHYEVVQARQLFHNRQEVTVIAARPRPAAHKRPDERTWREHATKPRR